MHSILIELSATSPESLHRLKRSTPSAPSAVSTDEDDKLCLERIVGLDAQRGIELCAGNTGAYLAVLRIFADLYRTGLIPRPAGSALLAQRIDIRRALHSFRGACASIGAVQLVAHSDHVAAGLEADLDEAYLSRHLARLEIGIASLLEGLRGVLDQNVAGIASASRH